MFFIRVFNCSFDLTAYAGIIRLSLVGVPFVSKSEATSAQAYTVIIII